jgi:lipid A disaccharide synthetase
LLLGEGALSTPAANPTSTASLPNLTLGSAIVERMIRVAARHDDINKEMQELQAFHFRMTAQILARHASERCLRL